MLLEPIEDYPKDKSIEYFKMDCSEEDLQEMISELPEGYDLIFQGATKEGDIFFRFGEWDIENPLTMPEYRQVFNHGVAHFHGVARRINNTKRGV